MTQTPARIHSPTFEADSWSTSSDRVSLDSQLRDQPTPTYPVTYTHINIDPSQDIELRPLASPTNVESTRLSKDEVSASASKRQWMQHSRDWGWELTACLLSLAGFFGIVGLLKGFDGKAQPDWPYGITLNSALAMLSTATKGLLIVPAAACISQSFWIRFAKSAHPLDVFTIYDDASRGPLGAVQLLWSLKVR